MQPLLKVECHSCGARLGHEARNLWSTSERTLVCGWCRRTVPVLWWLTVVLPPVAVLGAIGGWLR